MKFFANNKQMNKKGVALITVLLFMLMATIAATSVYKWLLSEDRASAARLKQNEAYQASQAGLNVARAWLAYNGNETAALISQFARDAQHRPISLNTRMNITGSAIQQEYSVLLAGVDTTSTGSLKVKLISTGMGRNGSSYSQVAILNVEGLYRVEIPAAAGDVDYNYAYFGGSLSYAADHKATSMLVNGNWSGNPLRTEKDFIITGNVDLSGSDVDIGGTGCIGGDMLAGNGLTVKSIYVDGDASGKLRTITGDAYFNGDVDLRSADFSIAGNFFANGKVRVNQNAHSAIFQQNFCFSDNGKLIFESESNGHEFRIQNNIWMPSSGALNGAMTASAAGGKKFGVEPESQLYIAETYVDSAKSGTYYMHQEGDFLSEAWGMISGEYNWRYFVSNANSRYSTVSGTPPFDCADSLPDFCSSKWHPSSEGCDGTKYKIDDLLTTAYDSFEKKANKVSCSADIRGFTDGSTTVDGLNNCYKKAVEDGDENLYNGFLVVKFTENSNANPTGVLDGKFIIIYESYGGGKLRLPPSVGTTLLYLNEGAGDVDQSVLDANAIYNYFFYTKKNIGQMLTGSAPWRGSVYGEAASCAKLGLIQGGVSLEYDASVVNELVKADILCKAGTSCGTDSDDGSESTESAASMSKDKRWISLAPTLKITLLSQYANQEYVSIQNNEVEKGVLVMPRVIYLNAGDQLSDAPNKAYNVVYLGGLEPSGSGSASCYYGPKFEEGTFVSEGSPFTLEGLHTCRYTEGSYSSDFWVWVINASSGAKVSFDTLNYNLGKACESTGANTKDVTIRISSERAITGGTLYMLVSDFSHGATLTTLSSPSGLFTLTDMGSSDGGELYKLELPAGLTAMNDPLFRVSMPAGSCFSSSGFVKFLFIDRNLTDNLAPGTPQNELILLGDGAGTLVHYPVADDPAVSDSLKELPECTAYDPEDVVWTPETGCSVPAGTTPDNFYGPWNCELNTDVIMNVSTNVDPKVCYVVQTDTPTVVSTTEDTKVYASLKKTSYTLSIDIQGLMGTANIYESQNNVSLDGMTKEELEADAEVELLDGNDKVLGTCKTGGVLYKDGKYIGPCDITVFYGQHYYVRAKGKYFDHWSYDCVSKSSTNTCGTATGASTKSRVIAVVISENVTLRANYTKTGYCFNEDFTHLHPYCDEEVTPKKIGGFTWFREIVNGKINPKFFKDSARGKPAEEKYQIDLNGDFAHGNGEYCIDQCVTNKAYRYSELGSEFGTQYVYYYDYYCSVEGETIDGTIEKKENEVWSYYDPGISCTDMVDRAFDEWHMDWTIGKTNTDRENEKKKCVGGASSTYRCLNNKDASVSCSGLTPPSLAAPRVYGGYYPQNDPYSPWLKVMNVYQSRQSKLGVRRYPDQVTVRLDDGSESPANGAIWNIKPYIDNRPGAGYMSAHGSGTFLTSFVVLRKEKAGYNGTYTKTFTWKGGGQDANKTGTLSSLVFRSNADATSYFMVGVNPSADAGSVNTRHFILCHATERTINSAGTQPSDSDKKREVFSPMNTGHCVAEEVFSNLPWNAIKDRTMQLKVELDGPNATITFAYSNENSSDRPSMDVFNGTGSTIYVKKTFNLEDPGLFNYPIPDNEWSENKMPLVDASGKSTHIYKNPIEHMRDNPDQYGYVGFTIHSSDEKIYNLNWRSGGSCGNSTENPGVYCGYETAEVKANTHSIPVRYVYDICPDQGECVCDYWYSLNGSDWVPEKDFVLPPEARKYTYGALKVKAECRDEIAHTSLPLSNNVASCNGFTTYEEGGDNKCYDRYTIFNTYNKADDIKLFEMYNSQITGLDNNYKSKLMTYAGSAGDALRRKYCVDTEENVNPGAAVAVGENHYVSNGYCSEKTSTGTVGHAHGVAADLTIDGVKYRVHPSENGANKNTNINEPSGKLMLVAHNTNADPYEGITTNYLQLTDTIDNSNTKQYLNLKNSDITFRLYQNNVVDDIRFYLMDDNGVLSRVFSLDEPGLVEDESDALNNKGSILATRNLSGEYCDIYDHRISEEQYNNLDSDTKDKYHQELCMVNLVWVRDLKRFARGASDEPGHTWSGMYPYRKFRISVGKLAAGTTFDPTRVSRIYFEVENDRGGGIHIGQLKVDCPTALDVLNCKVSAKGTEKGDRQDINEGQNVLFSANVPGATYCKLNIHQNGANVTYQDISGYPTEWFACNNTEQFFKTDSMGLQCDNPTTNCSAKFTIVAKNASDELDSCTNSSNTGIVVNVNNTSYFCYGYNTDYSTGVAKKPDYKSEKVTSLYDAGNIEYEGSGSISMGIDFNDASNLDPKPNIKLVGPDGQVIQELGTASISGETAADRFARCAQRKEGTTWIKYKSNGTFNSYEQLRTDRCAFFQFDPARFGTGEYKLVMGNGNVEACKINVRVPARKLGQCGLSLTTANKGGTVNASADGEFLDGVSGSLTIGSKTTDCGTSSYKPFESDNTRGTVACSFDAPTVAGEYPVTMKFGGLTSDCGTLVVADKPTPTDCKVSGDGRFVAKITNQSLSPFNYRLVRCADLLGNGCTVDAESAQTITGTSNGQSVMLNIGTPTAGNKYTYVFQVSVSGDYGSDMEQCSANYDYEGSSVECSINPNPAEVGRTAEFITKNAVGLAGDVTMSIREKNGSEIGTVYVKADGTGNSSVFTVPSTPSSHTYELYNGSNPEPVCSVDFDAVKFPITATCKTSSASVDYGGSVDISMSDVQNIHGDTKFILKSEKGNFTGSPVSGNQYYVPSFVGKIDATMGAGTYDYFVLGGEDVDADADTVCKGTFEVKQFSLDCVGKLLDCWGLLGSRLCNAEFMVTGVHDMAADAQVDVNWWNQNWNDEPVKKNSFGANVGNPSHWVDGLHYYRRIDNAGEPVMMKILDKQGNPVCKNADAKGNVTAR